LFLTLKTNKKEVFVFKLFSAFALSILMVSAVVFAGDTLSFSLKQGNASSINDGKKITLEIPNRLAPAFFHGKLLVDLGGTTLEDSRCYHLVGAKNEILLVIDLARLFEQYLEVLLVKNPAEASSLPVYPESVNFIRSLGTSWRLIAVD
jgi:hypothetical protein